MTQKAERVKKLLRRPNARIRLLMSTLHPTEIAQVLEDADDELQERIVRQLPRDIISQALSEMSWETKPGEILANMAPQVAAGIINELDLDDAADLLQDISPEPRARILHLTDPATEAALSKLISYHEDSAGGLMNPDVVAVQADMTKVEALREVTRLAEETDDFYMIYVVDENRHLLGYVSFKALFRAKSHEHIRNIMDPEVVSVTVDTDQEDVAKLVSRYNLPTLPVVDMHNRLVGTVTFDDIMDVIEEENTEDILLIAGVSDNAGLRDGLWASMKTRLPWLMVNLATASLSGFVVSLFSSTIDRIVILASFMPIIAGIAGNGATQALAVTIRRISTEGIPGHKALRVILKEISVGGANGVVLGVIASVAAALIALAMGSSPIFGLVIFSAMCANMLISGLAGSSIPIMLERAGADPAVASSILITAITDVLGFSLLLGLASLLL